MAAALADYAEGTLSQSSFPATAPLLTGPPVATVHPKYQGTARQSEHVTAPRPLFDPQPSGLTLHYSFSFTCNVCVRTRHCTRAKRRPGNMCFTAHEFPEGNHNRQINQNKVIGSAKQSQF